MTLLDGVENAHARTACLRGHKAHAASTVLCVRETTLQYVGSESRINLSHFEHER